MATVSDEVIFECPLLKLRGTRRKGLKLGGSNTWQSKYFVLKKEGNLPYLIYYNKKPKNSKIIPRGRISLGSSFRVEKSMNAKSRAYVFEVITPARHLCLSADEQKTMDLFVFFLQIQMRLSNDVIDDYFIVQPENSEAHRRIGARGTFCLFHVSPWGVTLALQNSRAVLAQWPLKCIRCYESNANGQFILEAGRIAPMGDGVYVFNTRPNEDNAIYDLLDKYVLAATAALQGRHPNNQEQFHDLQLELDRLNALTAVSSNNTENTELSALTIQNYNYTVNGGRTPQPDLVNRVPPGVGSSESLGYLHPTFSSGRKPARSGGGPEPIALTNEMFGVRSTADRNRNIVEKDQRPPQTTEPHRPSLVKSVSAVQPETLDDTDGYLDMRQSMDSLDRVLNRAVSVPPVSPISTDWVPPPSFVEATRASGGSYTGLKSSNLTGQKNGTKADQPNVVKVDQTAGPVLPAEDQYYLNPRASEPDIAEGAIKKPPVAPRGKGKNAESPATTPRPRYRMMRLKSRSCEDMSDFERAVYSNEVEYVNTPEMQRRKISPTDDGKATPEPFIGLDPFENKRYSAERPYRRFVKNEKSHTAGLDSPNASHSRQYFPGRQQVLGRSVSNPNFFDLDAKDILTVREKNFKATNYGSPSLGKSSARSLASLLPGALKRHLSRENNSNNDDGNDSLLEGQTPRPRSNSLRLRSNSISKSAQDLSLSGFVRHFRRSSFGSKDSISASTKGITMTEKSRSFRKQKSTDSNLSRQTSEVSGASSVSPTMSESPRLTGVNGHSPQHASKPYMYDTHSLPVRRKNISIMAGRRLPSLPDEKKTETAC